MKKMVRWFDVLKKNNVEIKLREEEEKEQADQESAEKETDVDAAGKADQAAEKEETLQTEAPASALKKEAAPKTNEPEEAKNKITKK